MKKFICWERLYDPGRSFMKIILRILKWFANTFGGGRLGQFTTDDINHFLKYDYSYQMLIDKDLHQSEITTDKIIQFKKNLALGCRKKDIISLLGHPQYLYHNKLIKGHQILFYKSMINGYRTNTVMHIYNNKFFLGMYLIKKKDVNKENILRKLREVYAIPFDIKFDYTSKIVDKVGNVIKIEDFNYLTIGYFDLQNPDFDEIANLILERDIKNGPEN